MTAKGNVQIFIIKLGFWVPKKTVVLKAKPYKMHIFWESNVQNGNYS